MTISTDRLLQYDITFGPFRLVVGERLLERDGLGVPLSGHALDVLVVLVRNAPQVVSKKELMKQVWPNVVVDEGNLRFHVGKLRKALGDGHDGARYIATLAGRGYCFVAELAFNSVALGRTGCIPVQLDNLPGSLTNVVGRDDVIREISTQLMAHRFLSVIGPGGIGKTTVAVCTGRALHESFAGAVCYVELGQIRESAMVDTTVASTLGLPVQSTDPLDRIVDFLRDDRMLLILDSCEHVIDAAAALTEKIHARAPQVHILVTSREALRVEGERVHRLAPLESPPEAEGISVAEAMTYPAVQLFVERAAASDASFMLSDTDVAVVAGICRRLDGLALAIELAAGRVGAYGIRMTAQLLDDRLRLTWRGRRTALPRHQTLAAALDWSHLLLSETERMMLRRLSVFVGTFDFGGAQAVVRDAGIAAATVLEAVASLVAKSLVTVVPTANTTRYRLLDTTRAYAFDKLVASGELGGARHNHAAYFMALFSRASLKQFDTSRTQVILAHGDQVGDVHAALEWSFGHSGDPAVGTAIVAAAAPLFLRLGMLTECHRWAERAIASLDDAARGTRQEMELLASLGQSLMFTRGNTEQVRSAYERALTNAEAIGCSKYQMNLMGQLNIFHARTGEFHAALEYAQRNEAVAARLGDPLEMATAQALLGISLHLLGRNEEAEKQLSAALRPKQPVKHAAAISLGFEHHSHASIGMARILWLQGKADQAVNAATLTIDEAIEFNHPVTLCKALLYALGVFMWTGEHASAQAKIDSVLALSRRHSLAPYSVAASGMRGELAIREGRPEEGVELVRQALQALRQDRYEMLTTAFSSALAEGMAAMGDYRNALTTIETAIEQGERNGDLMAMAEMLRIKGIVLLHLPWRAPEGETVLLRSLEVAAAQAALAWELRTAISLASRWLHQGRAGDAKSLLAGIYNRFTEGFGTADLRSARRLLDATCTRTRFAGRQALPSVQSDPRQMGAR